MDANWKAVKAAALMIDQWWWMKEEVDRWWDQEMVAGLKIRGICYGCNPQQAAMDFLKVAVCRSGQSEWTIATKLPEWTVLCQSSPEMGYRAGSIQQRGIAAVRLPVNKIHPLLLLIYSIGWLKVSIAACCGLYPQPMPQIRWLRLRFELFFWVIYNSLSKRGISLRVPQNLLG